MDKISEISAEILMKQILRIISIFPGIKDVDLRMKLMSVLGPFNLDTELTTNIMNDLVSSKMIVVIQYTLEGLELPRVIYFPKGTEINQIQMINQN